MTINEVVAQARAYIADRRLPQPRAHDLCVAIDVLATRRELIDDGFVEPQIDEHEGRRGAADDHPRVHALKCWPAPFRAVCDGSKRHEVRVNDRDFRVGDALLLQEWNQFDAAYTGDSAVVTVTHMTYAGTFGLPADVCVMSIELLSHKTEAVTRVYAGESRGELPVKAS